MHQRLNPKPDDNIDHPERLDQRPRQTLRAASSLATNLATNAESYGGRIVGTVNTDPRTARVHRRMFPGDHLWDTKGVVDGRDGRRRLN
jgi:hypothetical protein